MILRFITLAMALQNAPAAAPPANFLYYECKVAIAINSNKLRDPDPTDWMNAGGCISYLHGFIDSDQLSAKRLICAPDGTDMLPIAANYVHYVDANPNMKSDDKPAFFVLLFLKDSYPCPSK